MTADTALTLPDFSLLLEGMRPDVGEKIAVAVSGGADSMALAILLGDWCRVQAVELTALTVDHGLRADAAAEAQQVGAWLAAYDIPHEILNWRGDKPQSNIQDEARRARYRLMGDWCRQQGISKLFLAHHQGDQAETFLIRLLRGSGVEGLAAMARVSDFPQASLARELRLCRPLLAVAKARLTATLTARGQAWIEDPSNQNDSYTRVRVRKLLKETELEGLSVARMAQTADRMARVQSLLDEMIEDLEKQAIRYHPEGYAEGDLALLRVAHAEICLRLLARVLRKMGGGHYAPRFAKLEALYARMADDSFQGQSLGGCVVRLTRDGCLQVRREAAAITEILSLAPRETKIWDGRFRVTSEGLDGDVQRLDQKAWQQACEIKPALRKLKLPKVIRETFPCLVTDSGAVHLPQFVAGCEKDGFRAVTLF